MKPNEKNRHKTAVPAADVEQDHSYEPVAKNEITPPDPRFNIIVTSYRKRLHDTDGVSVKFALDGLVRAGILPNDTAQTITSVLFYSKIAKEEKTVIELIPAGMC